MTTKRNRNETLSLNLSPEVAKIMPWIVAAKASGKPGHSDWAKKEYERAEQVAREREKLERRLEERRQHHEWLEQIRHEQDEADRQKRLEEKRAEQALLDRLGIHLYPNEFREQEFLPSQSSQKGWRRLLSEFPEDSPVPKLHEWGRGVATHWARLSRHTGLTKGRKPRKPWFKKTRAQHH